VSNPEVIKEAGKVVEGAVKKASKKDVGFFLKAIAVAVVVVAVGYALSLAFRGGSVSVESGGSTVTIRKEIPKDALPAGSEFSQTIKTGPAPVIPKEGDK
jgi:hypothetical protein